MIEITNHPATTLAYSENTATSIDIIIQTNNLSHHVDIKKIFLAMLYFSLNLTDEETFNKN